MARYFLMMLLGTVKGERQRRLRSASPKKTARKLFGCALLSSDGRADRRGARRPLISILSGDADNGVIRPANELPA
jgi:hypothetical protein